MPDHSAGPNVLPAATTAAASQATCLKFRRDADGSVYLEGEWHRIIDVDEELLAEAPKGGAMVFDGETLTFKVANGSATYALIGPTLLGPKVTRFVLREVER